MRMGRGENRERVRGRGPPGKAQDRKDEREDEGEKGGQGRTRGPRAEGQAQQGGANGRE